MVLGLMTALLLSVAMMFGLTALEQTPAGYRSKLSEIIRAEFPVDQIGTEVRMEPKPARLLVTYITRVDTKFDVSVQNAEMQKIGEFAIGKYQGRDKVWIDEIRIVRTEIHGRGCFQQNYTAALTIANPHRRVPGVVPGVGTEASPDR